MREMITGVVDASAARFALIGSLLIVLLQAGGPEWIETLRWDRGALAEFEWWRLWSGHLVHASWAHVGLNVFGLLLIGWLFPEPVPLRTHIARFAWLALACSLLLYLLRPQLGWYVGLSGVLHGSFVIGLWWLWRQGDGLALLLLAGLVAKLAWEHVHGPLTSDEELVGVPVETAAHSFGALAAVVWLLVAGGLAFARRRRHNGAP